MNINLRLIEDVDPAAVLQAVDTSRRDLQDWLSWLTDGYDLDAQTQFHRRARSLRDAGLEHIYAIAGPAGHVLGVCSLHRIDQGNAVAEAGYWVRSDARRQGVAVTAMTALLGRAFEALELVRVELVIDCENTASLAVARRLGAICEGRLADRLIRQGVHRDAWLYAITR